MRKKWSQNRIEQKISPIDRRRQKSGNKRGKDVILYLYQQKAAVNKKNYLFSREKSHIKPYSFR